MSKNNSPQTRPGSVRRRRPKPQAPAPAPKAEVKQSKLRRFLPALLIPHGVAVLLVVVVAVAALMFSATSMVALPATIAQLWLALNMSAIFGSGEVVGVIPMVPGILLVWAIARRVHNTVKERVSITDLCVIAGLVLGLPLLLAAAASAMLYNASGVLSVAVPPVPVMLGRILLLHLTALVLGMGPRLWRALARRYGAPEWLIDAAALAIRFLITYAVVALVVVLIMLAVNYQTFTSSLNGYEEASAMPALIITSLLYLPNMIVYAMGILVGAPLYFGDGSISLFSVHMVPLPPLPILAAFPPSAPSWAVAMLLVPAIIAVWVCIKNPMRLRVNMMSALFGATFFIVLSLFAGGPLGVYGYVGLNLLPAFGLMLGYLVIIGLLLSGIDRLRASAGLREGDVVEDPEPEPEVVEEPVPEESLEDDETVEDLGTDETDAYIEEETDTEEPQAPEDPTEVEDESVEGPEEQEGPETTAEETNDGSQPDSR